jgi:hypothetical protein
MTRTKILPIGVFHMEHHPDFVQQKQTEISSLVDQIAVYNPTKIAVEWQDDDAEGLSKSFFRFLEYEDFINDEIHQLGFRLAKKLNHQRLYPIDHAGKITEDELNQLLTEIERNYPSIQRKLAEFNAKQIQLSLDVMLADVITQLNDHAFVNEMRQMYLSFAAVRTAAQSLGVDFLAKWHERELRIFSNIRGICTGNNDRILLFIGGDHLWTLLRLFEDSGCFEVQEPCRWMA